MNAQDRDDKMEKQKKVGRLQQMSDEMKQHIAQLKAELGNTEGDRRNTTEMEKEVRNKVIASTLRKHLENAPRSKSMESCLSEDNHLPSDKVPLQRHDAAESLSRVIVDSTATKEYSLNPPEIGPPPSTEPEPQRNTNFVSTSEEHEKTMDTADQTDPDATGSGEMLTQNSKDLNDCASVNPEPPVASSVPSTTLKTLPYNDNTEQLLKARSRKPKKSRNGDSTSDTSSSNSPRSAIDGAEDGIPVKYLQMSTTASSPRASKKKKGSKLSQRSMSQDRILEMNPTPRSEVSQLEELESKLSDLQDQCELLAVENIKIKREQRSKAEEKIAMLKKRNGELANIARRLEEKARSLQEQNVKKTQDMASLTRDVQQLKRTHQRHKGRSEAEQTRALAEKDEQLAVITAQLEDLKKALRQSRRLKQEDTEGYAESDIMRQTQKEMLQLQKLAAAASSKVIVRSLSTPVTARQKILEESNRTLRRQIATLEGSIHELEAKVGHSSEAEERLKIVEDEKQQLNFEIDGHKNRVLCLESELQKSKVEASDVSVQLAELKHVHIEVQNDYSTVHEQLAVAIKERDQAVARCIDHVNKAEEMETTIKSLYDEKRDFGALQIRHQEAAETHDREVSRLGASHSDVVGEYEKALQSLQAKVSRLEQQCEEQDLNNKNLKDQLSSLMQWSQQSGKSPIDTDNTNLNNNVAPGGTPLPPAPPTGSPQVPRFTTSGAASAFRKPIMTSQPGDNEARRGSASLASSGSRLAPDQDDTEAEDFDEDEVNMPLPGDHNPLPHPIPHPIPHQHSPAALSGDLPVTQQPQGPPLELRVFIAKYTYNPYEGPNEQPEAELPLVAGDYVYVHGEMDSDGFFEGELLSGERGLVPSNFLEPVHDVPHANGAIGVVGSISHHVIPSDNVIRPITQRPVSGEGSLRSASKHRSSDSNASRSICSTSSIDLESRDHSSEDDVENRSTVLPFPRKLRVDKTLSHSLIIGWIAPQLGDDDIVEEYHVIVDGCLATVVNGNKSKAVVERIYHDKNCYSISVCAVTDRGRSEPGHCTLRFGHSGGKSDVISFVRVEHVTTGGARVSWEAVSSNRTCSLCVGEIDDENRHLDTLTQYQRQILVTCPMFRQTIGGLKPNTTYEVMVKCKGRKSDPDALSKPIRFTTPTIGPPDPPLGVQVEEYVSGSAESSLLVTWLPVTLKENGLSNGVPVSGYSVYINNIQVKMMEPGSSDQCHVTRASLVDHVTRILASDQSYQPRSAANSGDDKLILPSVTFTVRTLASGGQLSDHSTPYHLHRNVVAKLAHSVARQHAKQLRASPRAGPFVRGKQSNGMLSDVAKGTQPPVVPSIEITMDTSSEDDLPVVKEADLYRNSSKSRRTKSAEGRPHHEEPTSVFAPKMNGKSAVSTSNLQRNQNSHLPSEEEDSEVSVYSEEHSSSTSESYKRFPREERLSSRGQQRVASAADHRKQGSSSRQRGEPTRKRSNSPRSLHSDDHHTDGSWHSNLSEVHHQARSSSLARRLHHQHRRRLRNASSQSGGSTSEVELVEDSRVFLFVALYDYDPYTMSPNTEMLDEELAFSEGQLIKVYGDKDADGFYFGENQLGKTGHVPCNMVSEVQVDDFTMLEELFERGHLPSASPDESKTNGITSGDIPDAATRPPTEDPGRMCVALFDYDPKESSPNIDAEVELSFRRGDLILIRGQMDEDGFFQGELNGQLGLVPSNFLDDVSDQGAHSFSSSSRPPAAPSTVSANTMTDASIPLTAPLHPDPSPSSKRLHEPPSVASTSSNTSSHASDSPKKKGILSKGKKFFKKFGANEGRPKK